jgi:hypothetical protein
VAVVGLAVVVEVGEVVYGAGAAPFVVAAGGKMVNAGVAGSAHLTSITENKGRSHE